MFRPTVGVNWFNKVGQMNFKWNLKNKSIKKSVLQNKLWSVNLIPTDSTLFTVFYIDTL